MNVALAGSGGGSTRRSDAHEEVSALHTQLDALGATLTHVQLISCEVPLDRASSASRSKLWTLASSGALTQRAAGALGEVNAAAEACDQELAAAIDRGEVGALLLISADVAAATGVNRHALAAAVRARVPVCGTGGASLGLAAEAGARLLEVSGSVGTTSHTRAIAVSATLARHWRLPAYRPALRPALLSPLPLLDALLPAFVGSLLLLHAADAASAAGVAGVGLAAPLVHACRDAAAALPAAAATLAASRVAQLGESGVLAGAVAGGLLLASGARASSVPAGMLAGMAAGGCCRLALRHSVALGLPATAATLYTVAGSGAVGGLLGAAVAPAASAATDALRELLLAPTRLAPAARLAWGAAMGVGVKQLSVHGRYHGVLFPLILLEMEHGHPSLLGALDAACLCAVCGGVCAAVALRARVADERRAAARAARTNLLLGDMVEACYPYMAEHAGVRVAAWLGAALAGAIIVATDARSSAYLPLPLSAVVSPQPMWFGLVCVAAFAVPFAGTLCVAAATTRAARDKAVEPGHNLWALQWALQ